MSCVNIQTRLGVRLQLAPFQSSLSDIFSLISFRRILSLKLLKLADLGVKVRYKRVLQLLISQP